MHSEDETELRVKYIHVTVFYHKDHKYSQIGLFLP